MRLTKLAAGLGIMCGTMGCHHIAGFCDCVPPVQPCCIYGLYPAVEYVPRAVVPAPEAKPAVETPRAEAEEPAAPPAAVPTADPVKERIGYPKQD